MNSVLFVIDRALSADPLKLALCCILLLSAGLLMHAWRSKWVVLCLNGPKCLSIGYVQAS
ncbi:hypothetical protein PVE_R1G6081 [Pseudomonas veronii 1YdBTEX2]|uniref:Uncharacterized protein n=1 Tax=Pseudomonas veronii 1YdBTEX2 TaxID=1295141 RepID=A0A1D3K6N3_PSEVE|nr:hypothetical protein PVE_R1G6081 [Pseudomonas veronii 1YdBTEX2]